MNYIDITENKKTHSVNHRILNIINREGIQGPPGKNGITPTINEDTGTWMLGDVDTHFPAYGKPGSTPYIDEEYYWCIDGKRLIKANGIDDINGEEICVIPHIDENNFHWIINGKDTNVSALGISGDTPRIEFNEEDGKYYWWIGNNKTDFEVGISKEDIPQIIYKQAACDFPRIGNVKNLYVDIDTNEMYRWEASLSTYIPFTVTFDYIDGGNSHENKIITLD